MNCIFEDAARTALIPPDGAPYVAPKEVRPGVPFGKGHIEGAAQHLRNLTLLPDKLAEFALMYENENHPFFLDIKTSNGPIGPAYYSEAAGAVISGYTIYEPLGNYVYGLVGRLGGIFAHELRAGAALAQHPRPNYRDDPQDRPHVDKGIKDAEANLERGELAFALGEC